VLAGVAAAEVCGGILPRKPGLMGGEGKANRQAASIWLGILAAAPMKLSAAAM